QATDVHTHIRENIAGKWGISKDALRIQYGGSVSGENAGQLFESPQINGALVGKACLNPESFAKIISLAP
ncbi:MAG: triose-phosphate isomerase, partial [Nitrospirales bacterium]|nr:triose-phosphate isomerase [Nitrospirales bacterium]